MKMVDREIGGTAIFRVERYDRSYDECIAESIKEAAKKFHVGSNRLDWSGYAWAKNVIASDHPVQKALSLIEGIPEMYVPLIVGEAKRKVDRAFEDFKPYDTYAKKGNIWVNSGRNEIMKHATGTGTPTLWNNATAQLGVGNSATAPAVTQTALLGASTLYKAMDATFPTTPASQTFNARSTFGDAEALFNWLEEAFRNGATALVLWNRANTALGDKTSVTETWILTGSITW